MAKDAYVGINGKARKVKNIYIGVNGKARNVKKGYIGVNGKARLFYESEVPFVFGYKTGTYGSKSMSFSSIPFEPVFAMAVSQYSDGYNMGFYTTVPSTGVRYMIESGNIETGYDSNATASFSDSTLNINFTYNSNKFSRREYYYIIAANNENHLHGYQYLTNNTNQISINIGSGKKVKSIIIYDHYDSYAYNKISVYAYANGRVYKVSYYEDNGYYQYADEGYVSGISFSYSNGNVIISYSSAQWVEGKIYYCIAFE